MKGLSVVIPKDVVREQADSLQSALSPFVQGLGYIGDRIGFFRFKSAIKILKDTQKLAKRAGLKLRTPPLKFLVPLIESASFEEESDPLCALWTQLLLKASTESFQPKFKLYHDLLKSLSYKEAKLLKHAWQNYQKLYQFQDRKPGINIYVEKFIEGRFLKTKKAKSSKRMEVKELDSMKGYVRAAVARYMMANWDENSLDRFFNAKLDRVFKEGLGLEVSATGMAFSGVVKEGFHDNWMKRGSYRWEKEQSHALLLHYGLLEEISVSLDPPYKGSTIRISVNYLDITSLGFDFVQTCNP